MRNRKFFGVVEGFYRRPFSFNERADLIAFMADIGLDTYVYGPKMDPFHRQRYRSPYPAKTMKKFERLQAIADKKHVHFVYALSPGGKPDPDSIIAKCRRFLDIGIRRIALFYDDIEVPRTVDTAGIQCETAHAVYSLLQRHDRQPVVFFCPTQYHGFSVTEYMTTVSRGLRPEISMIWTGKRVVSFRITRSHMERARRLYGRDPLIWDNFFANDYMPPGVIPQIPYRYRDPAVVTQSRGVLINPMNEYQDAKRAVYTAARFFRQPDRYCPRSAWREALKKV